jgi:hypothetical protein
MTKATVGSLSAGTNIAWLNLQDDMYIGEIIRQSGMWTRVRDSGSRLLWLLGHTSVKAL